MTESCERTINPLRASEIEACMQQFAIISIKTLQRLPKAASMGIISLLFFMVSELK